MDIPYQVGDSALGISWPSAVTASIASTIDCIRPAPYATVLVVVRLNETALVLVPDGGQSLFGRSCTNDVLDRDLAVKSCNETASALLGAGTPWMSFLAGEWVDAGLSWRVVLCACGGPLRPDMALAISHGSCGCRKGPRCLMMIMDAKTVWPMVGSILTTQPLR